MPTETGMRGLLVYKNLCFKLKTCSIQIIYCFLRPRPYQTVTNVVQKMRIAPASK